jgi:hypothetical protein
LLCGKQLERGSRENEHEVLVEDIVADSYVRFFRYPDDLSPRLEELPWVSTRSLAELVKLHVEKPIPWLDPFTMEFRLMEWRKKIKGETESADHSVGSRRGKDFQGGNVCADQRTIRN